MNEHMVRNYFFRKLRNMSAMVANLSMEAENYNTLESSCCPQTLPANIKSNSRNVFRMVIYIKLRPSYIRYNLTKMKKGLDRRQVLKVYII